MLLPSLIVPICGRESSPVVAGALPPVRSRSLLALLSCPSDPPQGIVPEPECLHCQRPACAARSQSPPAAGEALDDPAPQQCDYVSSNDGTSTTLMLGENTPVPPRIRHHIRQGPQLVRRSLTQIYRDLRLPSCERQLLHSLLGQQLPGTMRVMPRSTIRRALARTR